MDCRIKSGNDDTGRRSLRLDLAQHRLHLLQDFTGLFRVKRVYDIADCLHFRVARIDPRCDQAFMQDFEHFISFEHHGLQAGEHSR